MAGRYELSDQSWETIEDIVSPSQPIGRPRGDDRQVLNGIFWILCSGAKWRDLPERHGPWKTAVMQFRPATPLVERIVDKANIELGAMSGIGADMHYSEAKDPFLRALRDNPELKKCLS